MTATLTFDYHRHHCDPTADDAMILTITITTPLRITATTTTTVLLTIENDSSDDHYQP